MYAYDQSIKVIEHLQTTTTIEETLANKTNVKMYVTRNKTNAPASSIYQLI